MRNYIIFILYAFTLSSILTSCKARFYTPNRNPIPLFKEKGDLYADVSTDLATKGDITVGYAITDYLGCYAGYGGARVTTVNDTANGFKVKYYGDMMNLGLGYFMNQEKSKNLRFEIFGDVGLGTFKNKTFGLPNNFYLNGNYIRIGIMPNIGYTTPNEILHCGYSMRLSNISFYNTTVGNTNYWQYDINRLEYRPSYNLMEHAFMVRVGGKNVKFQTELAFYHVFNNQPTDNAIQTFNSSLMIGVVFNMNVLNKGGVKTE